MAVEPNADGFEPNAEAPPKADAAAGDPKLAVAGGTMPVVSGDCLDACSNASFKFVLAFCHFK